MTEERLQALCVLMRSQRVIWVNVWVRPGEVDIHGIAAALRLLGYRFVGHNIPHEGNWSVAWNHQEQRCIEWHEGRREFSITRVT